MLRFVKEPRMSKQVSSESMVIFFTIFRLLNLNSISNSSKPHEGIRAAAWVESLNEEQVEVKEQTVTENASIIWCDIYDAS